MKDVQVRAHTNSGRAIPAYTRRPPTKKESDTGGAAKTAESPASLLGDYNNPKTLQGLAFEVAFQESVESAPRVPREPHIIRDPDGGWVDAANAPWSKIPKGTPFAKKRMRLSGELLNVLANELGTAKDLEGNIVKDPYVRNRLMGEGRLSHSVEISDLRGTTPEERDALADRVANVVIAEYGDHATEELQGDVRRAARELVSMIYYDRTPAHQIELREIFMDQARLGTPEIPVDMMKGDIIFRRACELGHEGWGDGRLDPKKGRYLAPLVYEDENGHLVNVHEKGVDIPDAVREAMAEKVERELVFAAQAQHNAGIFSGRKVRERIAAQLYRQSKKDEGRYAYKPFDELPKGKKEQFLKQAEVRRKQVRRRRIKLPEE